MYYMGRVNYKQNYAFTYLTIHKYLENKIIGKNTADFFQKNNIKSIAIYGLGTVNNLGKLFYDDISNSEVEVKYFIDKNHCAFYDGISGIPVIGIDALPTQEPVDSIIVTPVFYITNITEDLINAGVNINKIISLADIVFSL